MDFVGANAHLIQPDSWGEIIVGGTGNGYLTVDQGATADAGSGGLYIGGSPANGGHSYGLTTISNAAQVSTAGPAILGGYGGSGDLTIVSGGSLHTASSGYGGSFIGLNAGGTSHVLVSGANSIWAETKTIYVGGATGPTGSSASLTVADGGKVTVGQALNIGVGGAVAGDGTIVGTVINAGGTVSPGLSPGALHIAGSFTQQAGSTLNLEIAGAGAGQFDQVLATGNISLGGIINLAFENGYAPHIGDHYDLFHTGGVFNLGSGIYQITGVPAAFQYTTNFSGGV